MDHELEPAAMSDAELLRRYQSAEAENLRLWSEFLRAESTLRTDLSPENVKRVLAARATWRAAIAANGKGRLGAELLTRLNAPLKAARVAKGLSQGETAKRAGWMRSQVSDIEAGNHRANFDMYVRMWKALDLDLPEGWQSLAEATGQGAILSAETHIDS